MKNIKILSALLLLCFFGTPLLSQAQAPDFSGMYSETFQEGEAEFSSRAIVLDLQANPATGSYIFAKADGTDGYQKALTDLEIEVNTRIIRFKLDGEEMEGEFMEGSDDKLVLMIFKDGETWNLSR